MATFNNFISFTHELMEKNQISVLGARTTVESKSDFLGFSVCRKITTQTATNNLRSIDSCTKKSQSKIPK